ncbi:M20/M25/M40 family metallo-hydrolase [Pectinatus frisingensis]|uniref:M20/M25/M40 family metallo-hydrolase n=1 Tax=Pectinatus frisingensis TaxID=865 RepID=UPI0018C8082E|nr:M20/M25/M40 family metallo-hydrolase [Pectinatus frisingensis]
MINEKRLLDEFLEFVKIRCSTRQERKIADIVTRRLIELGCTVQEDDTAKKINGDTGNLVAYLKGNVKAPVLMLTAHLDCVEPCENVRPQVTDGIIRSDGSTILGADDKVGVAGILEVLRVLKEDNVPHGDLQIVFTVAEEGGVNGSKNMDKSLLKAELGYTLDTHGAPGKIVVKAPGQNKIFVKVKGKAAHAGIAPEKGNNAIIAAAKMLTKIPQGRVDEESTCNVGVIRGGRATNIVAEMVEIDCEARSRNKAKMEILTDKICHVFEQGGIETGTQVEVKVKKSYDPYEIAEDSAVVQLAAQAARKMDLTVSIEESGGGSDANFFNSYGIPCAVLGVGMANGHTVDEFIKEEDLYNAARLTLQIVKEAVVKAN